MVDEGRFTALCLRIACYLDDDLTIGMVLLIFSRSIKNRLQLLRASSIGFTPGISYAFTVLRHIIVGILSFNLRADVCQIVVLVGTHVDGTVFDSGCVVGIVVGKDDTLYRFNSGIQCRRVRLKPVFAI